jgi:hypothetical protein
MKKNVHPRNKPENGGPRQSSNKAFDFPAFHTKIIHALIDENEIIRKK